jgi:SAM-dependent methyltransferase
VFQHGFGKLHSAAMELYLGIRTSGSERVPAGAVFIPYVPIPYRAIGPILSRLNLGPNDVFVDVGCGKGRVLCCASRSPVRKVIGIDFDERLVRAAEENAHRVRGRRAAIECRHARAEDFHYGDATVLYLYHPFERPIMDRFLARVAATRTVDRPLRIAYANAVHDIALRENEWLTKEDEWPPTRINAFPYIVTFWRSRT